MCQRERIAERGSYRLDACSCGRATLSIGPVSLRLERTALDELTEFLQLAGRRLVVRDEHGAHWRDIARTPDLGSQP